MAANTRRLPERWKELDPRTIELIARMNEEERRHFISLVNLSDAQIARLKEFLALPEDKWNAGFKIVTRSVVVTKASKTILKMTLGLAAILVAFGQIWTWVGPYLKGGFR